MSHKVSLRTFKLITSAGGQSSTQSPKFDILAIIASWYIHALHDCHTCRARTLNLLRLVGIGVAILVFPSKTCLPLTLNTFTSVGINIMLLVHTARPICATLWTSRAPVSGSSALQTADVWAIIITARVSRMPCVSCESDPNSVYTTRHWQRLGILILDVFHIWWRTCWGKQSRKEQQGGGFDTREQANVESRSAEP